MIERVLLLLGLLLGLLLLELLGVRSPIDRGG